RLSVRAGAARLRALPSFPTRRSSDLEFLGKSADETATHVIEKLAGLKGRAVILMHDTMPATTRALPKILDWIDQENRRRMDAGRSEEHTSELQSREKLVCRLLLEKNK